MREFGIRDEPIRVWEKLIGLTSQRYREGPIHGDLHGDNVRVRRGDAILIDFYSAKQGPVVADIAHLETSIVFATPPDYVDPIQNGPWRQTVDQLYNPPTVSDVLGPPPDNTPLPWLWNCVRQLRGEVPAVRSCETEYVSALAVYLLPAVDVSSGGRSRHVQTRIFLRVEERLVGYLTGERTV